MTSSSSLRGPYRKTVEVADQVYDALVARANSRGVLRLDQKALAAELELQHLAVHRAVARLLEQGRVTQIGKGSRGAKTLVVNGKSDHG